MTPIRPLPELLPAVAADAAELVRRYGLTAADLVVEVDSGDGGWLRAVRACGPRVLGVEPHLRTMAAAHHAGVPTLGAVFTPGVARYIARHYGLVALVAVRSRRAISDPTGSAAAALAAGGAVVLADGPRWVELLRSAEPPARRGAA